MPSYLVDGLTFDFPEHWHVSKYDDWSFYLYLGCHHSRETTRNGRS